MAKRKLNVLPTVEERSECVSDSNSSCSENACDSENDPSYQPKTKRKCYKFQSMNNDTNSSKNHVLLQENNEHTYSCVPVFTNILNENENYSNCSSESDSNDRYTSSRRISDRSTSSESIQLSKGKSGKPGVNFLNFKPKRQPKCFTKNAVMARMNRLRKKEYVASLEGNVECLKESNNELNMKLNAQQELIKSLKNEIQYLKNVLSNSKEIGMLLRRVCSGPNSLKISSSLLSSTSSNDDIFSCNTLTEDTNELNWPMSPNFDTSDIDNMLQSDTSPSELTDIEQLKSKPYGVCLHVANKQVSLEFCASCNQSASTSSNDLSASDMCWSVVIGSLALYSI